jgi:hypothetical protein
MARPESIALAGYYPAAHAALPSFASLIEFEPPKLARSHVLVDPCVGSPMRRGPVSGSPVRVAPPKWANATGWPSSSDSSPSLR